MLNAPFQTHYPLWLFLLSAVKVQLAPRTIAVVGALSFLGFQKLKPMLRLDFFHAQ